MIESHHLTPGVGTPDDVANLVLHLTPDESACVTGAVLTVDGEFTSVAPHVAQLRELIAPASGS
jgi:NAD(P)-dependent dehydrogenase (short-subunit alcohol dehydrogenase family)